MTYYLTETEWMHGAHMWSVNKCDTKTIADYFNCPETLIYVRLPYYRRKYAKIGEKAA